MKYFLILLVMSLIFIGSLTAQNLLNEPEGVVFDSLHERYLVSNWRGGSIVQIDSFGNQSYFVEGLVNCANMYILDTLVYVCTMNQNLVGLNLRDGTIISYLPIATSGLHDIAYDYQGNFYATDWSGNRILKIDIAAQTYSLFVDHDLYHPGGILMDTVYDRLLVTSFGATIPVQAIDIATGVVTDLVEVSRENLDDVVMDKDRNLYVSSWEDGVTEVFRFDNNLTIPPDVIYTGTGILIDLGYNERDHVVGICNSQEDAFILFDLDSDEDEVLLWEDNCPNNYNPFNEDTDSDGVGDLCDNCITVYNPDQADENMNTIGDACESCCIGTTGNANCSEEEEPDITDITRLIDFLYISHAELCCLEEADVNGSGGEPDISDITRLIDYLYISHYTLVPCP
ncbi:MAG: thrombospondin type 3 repeat-containing protein [Candidatus Zixiibacteriota bacterium]